MENATLWKYPNLKKVKKKEGIWQKSKMATEKSMDAEKAKQHLRRAKINGMFQVNEPSKIKILNK